MILRKLLLLETREAIENEMIQAGWSETDPEFITFVEAMVEQLPLYIGIAESKEVTLPVRAIGSEKIAYIIQGRLFIENKLVYKRGLSLWVNDIDIRVTNAG